MSEMVGAPWEPGHDADVGDGAISPPTPLRAVPAAPWSNRPGGGGAAVPDGARPEPPIVSRDTTAAPNITVTMSTR